MPRYDIRSLNINNLRNHYPCKANSEDDERFGFLLPFLTGGLIGFPLGYLVNNKQLDTKPYYYPYPVYPQYNENINPYNYPPQQYAPYPNYNMY